MDKNTGVFIERIRKAIVEESTESISDIYSNFDTKAIKDRDFHLMLAELLDQAGMYREQVTELNLALAGAEDPVDIHYKLAELHSDFGNIKKAVKNYRAIIEHDPDQERAYLLLGNLFKDNNMFEEASRIYKKAKEHFGKKSYDNLIVGAELDAGKEIVENSVEKDYLHLERLDDSLLIAFTELFSGREGVYAKQWVSPTGESGYSKEAQPFTHLAARNHILGNHTAGIYQLRMDNTVRFIAFDIDIKKVFLKNIISNGDKLKQYQKRGLKIAKGIVDRLSSSEIPSYLEDSGYKGYHVWVFLASPVPAKIAREFCKSIVASINTDEAFGIEIFPKQSYVKEKNYGNLIKIPLGIHRRTGKRCLFMDPLSDSYYDDQLLFLTKVKKVDIEMLQTAIAVQIPFAGPPADQGNDDVPWEDNPSEPAVEMPEHVPEVFDPENDIEFQSIISRCSVIEKLYNNALTYKELNNEEQLVIRHTLGHLKNGAHIVNHILHSCINCNDSYLMQSNFSGNPMSCPKIRKKIPDITSKVNCSCAYDSSSAIYPTPLMHIRQQGQSGIVSQLQLEKAIKDYMQTKKDLSVLDKRMQRLEEIFNEYFDSQEIEELSTSFAKLQRLKDKDSKTRFILVL